MAFPVFLSFQEEESIMSNVFSRRSFLKYTAVTAVAVAGSSLLGGCSDSGSGYGPETAIQTTYPSENKVLSVKSTLTQAKLERSNATFTLKIANGRPNPIQVDYKSFGLKFYDAQGQLIYNSYADGKINATCLEGESPRIARGKESTFQITASGVPADYAKLQFTFWPDLQYGEYTANWVLTPETINGTTSAGTNG